MFKCNKCGFGHKTLKEQDACKSWKEMSPVSFKAAEAPQGQWCVVCGASAPAAPSERGDEVFVKICDALAYGRKWHKPYGYIANEILRLCRAGLSSQEGK